MKGHARLKFPGQAHGYVRRGSRLYYVVLTPVYVQAESGQGLLNVLLMAFGIDSKLARELKTSTHGSDFVFVSGGDVAASTLPGITAHELELGQDARGRVRRIEFRGENYLLLGADLLDTLGHLTGRLFIIRSFSGPKDVLAGLRRNIAVFWTAGIIVALLLTYHGPTGVPEPVKDWIARRLK